MGLADRGYPEAARIAVQMRRLGPALYQRSFAANGDLANWHTGEPDAIPAFGGAMDLATGAKKTWVMMDHATKGGEPKIVPRCSHPVTGLACVSRIYTSLAVLDITAAGVRVREMAAGRDFAALQACTGVPLQR